MSKKDKEKKKLNPKKEKYLKFRKDKPSNMDMTTPMLSPDEQRFKQEAEMKVGRFWRFNKPMPDREVQWKRFKKRN